MSKYSKDHEVEFIAKIRLVLVRNPEASILNIQKVLCANGIRLDKDYINKLVRKIRGEWAYRYHNEAKNEAIAKFEDFVLWARTSLLKLYQETSNDMVKIAILNSTVKQYVTLLKMQFDAGVFNDNLERENKQPNMVEVLKILDEAQKNKDRNRNQHQKP